MRHCPSAKHVLGPMGRKVGHHILLYYMCKVPCPVGKRRAPTAPPDSPFSDSPPTPPSCRGTVASATPRQVLVRLMPSMSWSSATMPSLGPREPPSFSSSKGITVSHCASSRSVTLARCASPRSRAFLPRDASFGTAPITCVLSAASRCSRPARASELILPRPMKLCGLTAFSARCVVLYRT